MRVISGTRRSLRLKTVDSDQTRPTTDRIKETLFNMLQPYVQGSLFLDLFSGSGAIGIEALSRGARHAVFVDDQSDAVRVIRENIAFTKFEQESTVIRLDAVQAISELKERFPEGFDVIFMDPPYRKRLEYDALRAILSSGILKPDAVVIFEADASDDVSEAEEIGFTIIKQKKYGSNQHVWLKKRLT